MKDFFLVMTNISTIVALGTSIVFCIGIVFRSQLFADTDVFNVCNNQIKVCRTASVIFVVLYWFMVSGLPTAECLEGYQNIAGISFRLGYIWCVFAVVTIVLSIVLGILKKGKDGLEIMGKLRKSGFVMGAVFLVIAFILKVD